MIDSTPSVEKEAEREIIVASTLTDASHAVGSWTRRDKQPILGRVSQKSFRTRKSLKNHDETHQVEEDSAISQGRGVKEYQEGNSEATQDAIDTRIREQELETVSDSNDEMMEEGELENTETTHLSNEERTVKQFVCPHCQKTLKSRECLVSHVKRLHGEKKFQCGHCGLKCGLQSQLNTHVARDHEGK